MMNFERFNEERNQETGSEGFSEKELDLDIEIRAGEWQNLKKERVPQKVWDLIK